MLVLQNKLFEVMKKIMIINRQNVYINYKHEYAFRAFCKEAIIFKCFKTIKI